MAANPGGAKKRGRRAVDKAAIKSAILYAAAVPVRGSVRRGMKSMLNRIQPFDLCQSIW